MRRWILGDTSPKCQRGNRGGEGEGRSYNWVAGSQKNPKNEIILLNERHRTGETEVWGGKSEERKEGNRRGDEKVVKNEGESLKEKKLD